MEGKTLKTLDERIEADLKELYNFLTKQIVLKDIEGEEAITTAKILSQRLFVGDNQTEDNAFTLSSRGLPGYFTGDRKAKTVMVMLNPGSDVFANENPFNTLRSLKKYGISLDSKEKFVETYKRGYSRFGEIDIDRIDNFDIKQAAFLKSWNKSGVTIPEDFPEGVKNLDKETRDECLKVVKRNVLMQKLQLELIPYSSRKFDTSTRNLEVLMPYLETVLYEITKIPRDYVIFCSDVFEKIFEYAQQEKIATIETLLEDNIDLLQKDGKTKKANCTVVEITYKNKPQKALIAHTFPNQALSKAYDKMQKYGKFCYDCLNRKPIHN